MLFYKILLFYYLKKLFGRRKQLKTYINNTIFLEIDYLIL